MAVRKYSIGLRHVFCQYFSIPLILSTTLHALPALALPTPVPPPIKAKSAILMDFYSGKVLVESQADLHLQPASLTKMMTSYIVAQAIKAGTVKSDDLIAVSDQAWGKNFADTSKMFIKVGEKVSVADLHRGVVVVSGNDACVALAEHIAGSESSFVDMMNFYAKKLQLGETAFVNVHGLDHPEQRTTARDMAKLAAVLIRELPEEYSLYKEKKFTHNGIVQSNRNGLLWDENLNVDGVKTGHTSQAGYSLVSSATEGSSRLIAVVMGTESARTREEESRKLLRWGFRFFETVVPCQPGEKVTSARVWLAKERTAELGISEPLYLNIQRGRGGDLTKNIVIQRPLMAPIEANQIVGELQFLLDGKLVGQQPLRVLKGVKKGNLLRQLIDKIRLCFPKSTDVVST